MPVESIIEFRGVTLKPRSHRVGELSRVNLRLGPGDLVFIMLESEAEHFPLCDLAEGLVDPDEGTIVFQDEAWAGMSPLRLAEMRSRIGRVFDYAGWISNLTISENIRLAERHHTRRPEAEILDEMDQLCRFVGLPPVLDERPDVAAVAVLRRAQWVRAFMGSHALQLLERPEYAAPHEALPKLGELVENARGEGCAVIWTTLDQDLWASGSFKNVSRYRVRAGQLQGEDHE